MYNKIFIGQKFNLLTVIEKTTKRKNNSIVWLCQCECGNYKEVTSSDLNANRVKSCGCLNQKTKQGNYNDLSGKKFGRLLVLNITDKRTSNRGIIWHCKCDCGKEIDVAGERLIRGTSKSCGCYQKDKVSQINRERGYDLKDKKFGKLTPLYLLENTTKRTWHCKCDCGKEIDVLADYLLNGHSCSCGCGLYSKGELLIQQILDQNNIPYIREYKIKDCIFPDSGYFAKFDFFVNNKYLIEYNGLQHYEERRFGNKRFEELSQIQKRDKFKIEFCHSHNIPLICIPYTQYNKLSIKDLLLESSEFIV